MVHLVDGTYELFRHFFAVPPRQSTDGVEIAAARGVAGSMLQLLEGGATHVGIATDHVIESYRNELYAGYKTGSGVDPVLMTQFPILEDLLTALGFVVWPQITYEADDAMGAAAAAAASDDRVERVFICTPDKDLAQCVRGDRVVQLDRRKGVVTDRNGVIEKFGVPPESIPDYLGLVGDNADGFPGLPGWGAKTTAAVLTRYGHLENIPAAPGQWDVVGIRGAAKLAATLQAQFEDALLFRELARLQCEGPEVGAVDDWRWVGPLNPLPPIVGYVDGLGLARRAERLARSG